MNDLDLSPLVLLEKYLRYWWLIFLIAIAGGFFGWLFHFTQSPVYESQAVLTASIDYAQTGPISDTEEDRALVVIGELFGTTPVREKVIQIAHQKGIDFSLSDFYQMSSIDRKQSLWYLRIRSSDPQKAAEIANIWLDQSFQAAREAQSHSLQMQVLQRQYNSLLSCYPTSAESTATPYLWKTPTPAPALDFCSSANSALLPTQIAQKATQISIEKDQTHAIIPALTFSIAEQAIPAATPIRLNTNSFVLAGIMLGFCLGVLVVTVFMKPRLVVKNES